MALCLCCARDIPMPLVSSGVEHGNLRELALARMKDMGTEVKLSEQLTHSTHTLIRNELKD